MRRRVVALAILGSIACERPARGAFERAPVGPESAALGGTVATSEDVVFGNPAAWMDGAGQRFSCWFARPFGLTALRESQVGVASRTSPVVLGFGARAFGTRAYGEREARVCASWCVAPDVAIGAAFRGLLVRGDGFPPVRSAAVDLGLRLRAEKNTEFGVVVEALAGEVPGDPDGRHRLTSLGATREAGRWAVRLEVGRREAESIAGHIGFSCRPWSLLALHGGIRENPRTISWGMTAGMASASVAVGVEYVDPLGTTVRIGISASRAPGAGVSAARIRSSSFL